MRSILISIFCLNTLMSFSQMTLKKIDGTPINSGDVIVFNSTTDPDSYLGIKVYNSSSTDINVKIKCESISNENGSNVQLCFGDVCVNNIIVGNSYPNIPALIEANNSNGNFDHFLNTNTGTNPNSPIEYVFKFYQVTDSGSETGNSVTFTYRYSPNLANKEFNSLINFGINLKSNAVDKVLEFDTTSKVTLEIYDLNGKLQFNQNLDSGNQTIDISTLNSSVYFMSFTNSEGKKAISRFIKK